MEEHLVRVRFYAKSGTEKEQDIRMGEVIQHLGGQIAVPELPKGAVEHGYTKIDYINVEVFKKVER